MADVNIAFYCRSDIVITSESDKEVMFSPVPVC